MIFLEDYDMSLARYLLQGLMVAQYARHGWEPVAQWHEGSNEWPITSSTLMVGGLKVTAARWAGALAAAKL